ncbi:MAG: serine/threonine protein phosphatase [Nostocales cyanobacterium W4_Combined_metabat2_030]|nr:serine/threonine protein phosphatase [Nostocales cyanobacterium W4_Combined_metabat2_030]
MHRRFAIGDIHGCCKTLRKMVEDVLLLTPDDTLYLLGDYIDRGPNSIGVLDYLLHLKDSGFDIQPIRGNHEEMLLDAVSTPEACSIWYGNGGWGTLRELGIDSPEKIPQRYVYFLADLPYIITTENYVFVHAGLNFQTSNPLLDKSPQFMLWSRDCQVNSAKMGGRTLVTGHTVTPLYAIKESLASSHICLDNGCYDKGEISCGALIALNLGTRELLVQENIE